MAPFPKYVSDLGHGLVVPECPASIIDGSMYSFFVDADGAKLQALVDTFLNAPSNGAVEYHVMGSSVIIVFLRAPKHMTTVQPIGYIDDREFTVWIPLFARTRGKPDADRITFWMPYIVISSHEGMATGREIWGFRKTLGTTEVPADATSTARFSSIARVFDPMSYQTLGQWKPVIEVWKSGPMGELQTAWNDLGILWRTLVDLWSKEPQNLHVSRLGLFADIARLLKEPHRVPIVDLKQFRDCADTSLACYQSLVESTCTPQNATGGMLTGEWTAKFYNYDSYRLATDLGIAPEIGVPVRAAFWAHMNFSADLGVEVWRA
jgi:hypothetical protein